MSGNGFWHKLLRAIGLRSDAPPHGRGEENKVAGGQTAERREPARAVSAGTAAKSATVKSGTSKAHAPKSKGPRSAKAARGKTDNKTDKPAARNERRNKS